LERRPVCRGRTAGVAAAARGFRLVPVKGAGQFQWVVVGALRGCYGVADLACAHPAPGGNAR